MQDKNQNISNPKNNSTVKIILYTILTLIIITTSLYFLVPTALHYLAGDDSKTINDLDLQLTNIEIPDQQNAFYLLSEINKINPVDTENLSTLQDNSNTDFDIQLAKKVINDNTKLLDTFSAIAKKSNYQNPSNTNPAKYIPSDSIAVLSNLRHASELTAIKARVLLEERKYTEAMDTALQVIAVGHLISNSQDNMVNYLMGISIKNTGLSVMEKVLTTENSLTDLQRKFYARKLQPYSDNKTGLSNAFKFEYLIHKTHITDLANSDYNHYYFKPNQTINLFADRARDDIETVQQYDCQAPYKTMQLGHKSSIKSLISENATGRNLLNTLFIDNSSVMQKYCEVNILTEKILKQV